MPLQSTLTSIATAAGPQLALAASRQPLQSISANINTRLAPPSVRKKPGPKPKSLLDRKAVDKPVKRLQRTYSREKKIQVLTFLVHHKVVRARQRQQRRRDGASEADALLSIDVLLYRDVTLEEAGAFSKIPVTTIYNWWARREAILQNNSREGIPWWPDLEERLYERFWERRQQRLITSIGWFRRESRELFATLYPESPRIFTFSRGWFTRFLQRHCITRRRITHQAQKLPEELLKTVSSFLR
jgi:hypothetical protein